MMNENHFIPHSVHHISVVMLSPIILSYKLLEPEDEFSKRIFFVSMLDFFMKNGNFWTIRVNSMKNAVGVVPIMT